MPNSLRVEDKKKLLDDNFAIVESKLQSEGNYLQITYLIPQKKVSYEACLAYVYLLNNSNLNDKNIKGHFTNVTKRGGGDYKVKLDIIVGYYVLTFSIATKDVVNKKKATRYLHHIGKDLMKFILRSWSEYSLDFDNFVSYCKLQHEKDEFSDVFNMKKLLRINMLQDYPLGIGKSGQIEKIAGLKSIDISHVRSVFFESSHIIAFVGYPEFSTVLKFRKLFKPTPKLMFEQPNEYILSSVKHLVVDIKSRRDLIGCGCKVPQILSLKDYLLHQIYTSLIKENLPDEASKLGFCVLDYYSYYQGGVEAFIFGNIKGQQAPLLDLIKGMSFLDSENLFLKVKNYLLLAYQNEKLSLEETAQREVIKRLLMINLSNDKLLQVLEKITLKDFQDYLSSRVYIGEIVTKGETK